MRTQPRHLDPCQGHLSRKQSTSNTQAGLHCKPGISCPVPCPTCLKGSPNPALLWLQRWHRDLWGCQA